MIKDISESSQGLKILIPLPRIWPLAFFLGLWLAPWAMGEWSALKGLFSGGFHPGSVFLLVWLAGWTAGGAIALFAFITSLAGEEEVACDGRTFSICWGAFGWGYRKRWPVAAVKALGRAPAIKMPFTVNASRGKGGPVRVLRGLLFVLPGRRPVPFGWSLAEEEAEKVLARLRARHSFPVPGEGGIPHAGQLFDAAMTAGKTGGKDSRTSTGG
jgi:hypothetical protein